VPKIPNALSQHQHQKSQSAQSAQGRKGFKTKEPKVNDEDFCPKCGAYIEVDFDHYSEYDGRPVYRASCDCPDTKPEPKQTPNKVPKSLATLGDFLKK